MGQCGCKRAKKKKIALIIIVIILALIFYAVLSEMEKIYLFYYSVINYYRIINYAFNNVIIGKKKLW